jgi:DNA invertase Pin-like site-specific DNA recombinase
MGPFATVKGRTKTSVRGGGNIRNYGGYIRVSKVAGRSGESFISPKVQRERIEAVAAAGGHRIVRWFEDLDQSGAKSDRPGFQQCLTLIEAGELDGMVVAKLDRFSRSIANAVDALRRIDAAGGAFISAEDSLDTSTPMGRFALHMMLAIAELEWERRRESWEVARSNAVARGVHIASRTPTGYDKGEDGRLVANEYAERVAGAFRLKAGGASWAEIRRSMEGVPTPYGSVMWADRSLSHLLSNRVYLGEARSGEFVNAGAHEAVIDEGTFQLAQRKEQKASRRGGPSLLTGLLRCAGCRYCLKPDSMKPKYEGERIRAYRCRGTRAAGKCQSPASTLARVVEPFVVGQFLARFSDVGERQVADDSEARAAAMEVATATAQRDAFLSLDIADAALAQTELNRRQERLDAALAHHASLLLPEALDMSMMVETWPDLMVDEKRELLAAGIGAVFLRRSLNRGPSPIEDRVLILWAGEEPDGLPGPGRRNLPLESFNW